MKYLLFVLMLGGCAQAQTINSRGWLMIDGYNFPTDSTVRIRMIRAMNEYEKTGSIKFHGFADTCQRYRDSATKYGVLLSRAMVAKEKIKEGNSIDSINNVINIYQKKRLFFQTKAQRCAGAL